MKYDYKKTATSIAQHENYVRVIKILDHMIVAVTVLLYVIYLAFLLLLKDYVGLCRSMLVPAISVVLVSLFRYFYNAPRPYEVYDFEPLISKRNGGKSFPSRHVFSIYMIAMTLTQDAIYMRVGIFLMILGILAAILRVISGVHFIHDVIAGAVIGILCGVLGFYLF